MLVLKHRHEGLEVDVVGEQRRVGGPHEPHDPARGRGEGTALLLVGRRGGIVGLVAHADGGPDEGSRRGLVTRRCAGRLPQARPIDEGECARHQAVVDAVGGELRGQLRGVGRQIVSRIGPVGGHQGGPRQVDREQAGCRQEQRDEHRRVHLVALDDDVQDHDQDHHRDEQDRRDLSRPAVLRRWMAVIGHAGGPGTVPGPRARG